MPQWIPAVTALIAVGTALMATIVGPLISWNIAKRQIKATVISTNRQAWIIELRDLVSEYLGLITYLSLRPGETFSEGKSLGSSFYKIRLLLNPGEEDHIQLVKLISVNSHLAGTYAPEQDQQKKTEISQTLLDQREEIISLSQSILKREWERVKQGD